MKKIIISWQKTGLAAALMLLSVFLCQVSQARDIKLLGDDETERLLEEIIKPLMTKAGQTYYENNIHIVEDKSLNAFVSDGNHLFIHTGTLIRSNNVNELAGVIAHEIGHIKGGHILRQKLEIKEMNNISLISAALAGAAGVLSGRADAAFAIMLGGQSSALNQFVHYRANEERAADETAVKLLKATGQSPKGIEDFMKKINKDNQLNGREETPYFRTHPLTPERIAFFEKAVADNNLPTASPLDERYKKVRAKLEAYLGKPQEILRKYKGNDTASLYAQTIAYFKNLQFDQAQQHIDKLLQKEPQNPYFWELKGQMEFERGKISAAVKSFAQAYAIYPRSDDGKINYAAALLEENESPENAKKADVLLDKVLLKNPQSYYLWDLSAKAAARQNDMATAYYAAGEMAFLRQEFDGALKQLDKAGNAHPTPQLKIKIDDLKERIKQEKKKAP